MIAEMQITDLEAQITRAEANDIALQDSIVAAEDSLTVSLRKFAVSPDDENQRKVDGAEARLKDFRRRSITLRQSVDQVKSDLAPLYQQRDEILAADRRKRLALSRDAWRTELADLKAKVMPQLQRYMTLTSLTEGVPTGQQDLAKLFDQRDLAKQAEFDVLELQK